MDPPPHVGDHAGSGAVDAGEAIPWLSHAIDQILPAQAPLDAFVHHNTLHAFEHLPFHEAVEAAHAKLGAAGYLEESRYREAFRSGRISEADLSSALEGWLSEGPLELPRSLPAAKDLVKIALVEDLTAETAAGLAWRLSESYAGVRFDGGVPARARARIVAETTSWLTNLFASDRSDAPGRREAEGALREVLGPGARMESIRGNARTMESIAVACLWRASKHVARSLPADVSDPKPPAHARDAVLAVGGEDPNDLVHPVLIVLAGAFLDRGQSHWSMPDREQGFFVSFCRVLGAGHAVRPSWLATLGTRLRAWERRGARAEDAIVELLDEMGIETEARAAFVEATLLHLPGWAGMFKRLESAPGPVGRSSARIRLVDFLAVRLCLDVLALREAQRRLGHRGTLGTLAEHCAQMARIAPVEEPGDHTFAWPLFMLAAHAGLAAPDILAASRDTVFSLQSMLLRLDRPTRSRIWHEAYERHYREDLLRALHAKRARAERRETARFQVVHCIDDRCESIRRHFEEISPDHHTFGAAGFFNLAIAYRGIDDPSTFPLCPIVVTPEHRIEEEPLEEDARVADARRRRLRRLAKVSEHFRGASRSLLPGLLITVVAGLLAVLPMLASVFAPWIAGRLRAAAGRRLVPQPKTRLTLPRSRADHTGAVLAGFSVEEKALRVGTLLENIGLSAGFSRVVAIIGHDSSSVNNPHFAAYSCGACGGRSGGPNARLFARMANRPQVRELLRARGIDIPASTFFVGGVHDTCADRITLFDVEDAPAELADEIDALEAALDEACRRNAHERCRRFESAPLDPSLDEAHRHVEARSYDLSQARPELGHATNASCIVGRRALTRGLFLDRRAFLVSYDPSIDPSGEVIERILLAVGPVGAGINLEYLFSTTDNERYGAGTKLPHNVTGLFGVMNGASSDLRTGLPKQMIEIHEPIRLQLVVEAAPETLQRISDRQPLVHALVHNEWVRLVALDPETGQAWIYDAKSGFLRWEPDGLDVPLAASSIDWYAGKQGFVEPACIGGMDSTEVGHVA